MLEIVHSPDLVFVHLSDIHFRKGRVGDKHDTNTELRHELERDLRRINAKIPQVDGLIISGDIGFAGQAEEYDYAGSWLETIRELVNCPERGVMVTPGNHDVDRACVDGAVDQLHAKIRAPAPLARRDELLAQMLRDTTEGEQLFSGLKAYNSFAARYGCEVSRLQPYWERDFSLGHGCTLKIRGITSTLISGPLDDAETHRMFYGGAQRQLLRQDSAYRVVVGHHPPSWTLEGDDADRILGQMTVLQLFGHKHDQWLTRIGRGARLIAGALHPDRQEPEWDPRYAVIVVRALVGGGLEIRIFPRRWSKEEMMFIGDCNSYGHDYRDCKIDGAP